MATLRQKKLAKEIVNSVNSKENPTVGMMLEKVGYAKTVAEHKPKDIIEAKGVQEELANLGFDFDSAKKVVLNILKKGSEANRLKAAQEVFKVTGAYAPEKHLTMSMGDVLDQLEQYGQTPEGQDVEDK